MQAQDVVRRSPASGRLLNVLTPLLGLAGVGLLAYLIAAIGPSRIVQQLLGLGAVFPAVVILTGAKYPLQAAGWRLALPRHARPPWGESISATITGDAVGYLTWAGPFSGEPLRALLIRGSVPVAAGVAAGAIERAIYNATAALLVLIVLFALFAASHGVGVVWGVVAALGAVALILAARWCMHTANAATPRAPAPTVRTGAIGKAASLLDAAKALWRDRRAAVPFIALLCLAQHAILVGEAYLLLNALESGTTLRTALVFEAVTKIVNTAGVVVPGRVGVAEGGSAALAGALGFAASHGLSLALIRRVRALAWGAIGLALLPFQEARARRSR